MTTETKHGPETERALEENARYAAAFDRPNLDMPPSRHLAVIACMDARITVEQVLGLHTGEAHIIRNAGGLATDDAIRSLVISQHLLGTDEVLVIEHTGLRDAHLRRRARAEVVDRVDRRARRPATSRLPGPRGEPSGPGRQDPIPPVDQGCPGHGRDLRGRVGAAPPDRLIPGALHAAKTFEPRLRQAGLDGVWRRQARHG